MGIPYLQVPAEEAIQILDSCICDGYVIKDSINEQYYSEKANAANDQYAWNTRIQQWTRDTLKRLETVFVSRKELYNFRDAPVSPLHVVGANINWNNAINQLQARIDKLCQYDVYIREQFHVQVEVVLGDKITQSGNNNVLTQEK